MTSVAGFLDLKKSFGLLNFLLYRRDSEKIVGFRVFVVKHKLNLGSVLVTEHNFNFQGGICGLVYGDLTVTE